MKKYKVTAIEQNTIEWDIIEAEDADQAQDIANNDWDSSEVSFGEVVEMTVEEVKE